MRSRRLLGSPFVGAILGLVATLGGVPVAHAFVPPTYQSLGRGYGVLLGTYRLIDLNLKGLPMPPGFDLHLVIGPDTFEIGMGNEKLEKATYRVTEHYGEVYRLELHPQNGSKKAETLEVMLNGDILTLYEIDADGSDKTKLRFERVK